MSSEEKLDRALKAYLRNKGIEADSVWVEGDYEKSYGGCCETCHFTEISIKYTLSWRTDANDYRSHGSEEFSDMADLMRIAVEFSE